MKSSIPVVALRRQVVLVPNFSRKAWVLLSWMMAVWLLTPSARAEGYFGPHPDYAPSVLTYAGRGFATGALVGLGGGYLSARRDGFEGADWRPLVLGVGIGAIAGTSFGLTLGFIDLAADVPGRGNIALRDTMYGSVLGALLGTAIGGVTVIRSHEAEHVAFGAALGVVIGAGVGLAVGLIEGPRIVHSPQHRYPGQRIWPSFAALPGADGQLTWSAGAAGSF